MDKKNLFNHNGELLSTKDAVFTIDNRSFRYGDGMFATMRIINGKIQLFDIHFKRITIGTDLLKLKLKKEWTAEFLESQILALCEAKKISDNARVRLTFYRSKGGYYDPTTNAAEYTIEADALKEKGYPLNADGLTIDLFSEMEKPANLFSTYKTNNSLIYVLASLYKKAHELDDCLLLNSKSRIIETIDSNLFLVKGGEIFTPPTTEGCVAGVMREHLLAVMESNGIKYSKTPLSLEDLFTGEELFLTNTISGVQWISRYKVKEYSLGIAKILSDHINGNL